jgi:hypothetical protein
MLIHGMIIMGDPLKVGGHYGTVAVGKLGEEELRACKSLGERGRACDKAFSTNGIIQIRR